MRKLWRHGIEFEVEDGPATNWWKFWDLWAAGTWETNLLSRVDELLPPGGRFLDIGAWVGPISLWAWKSRQAEVLAFEPDPQAFAQLEANMVANGMAGHCSLVMAAAASHNGVQDLYSVAARFGESNSSLTYHEGQVTQVASMDIAELIGRLPRFDLAKCDVEGAEADFFPTLGPVLRASKTPTLLSIHPGRYGNVDPQPMMYELTHWQVQPLDDAGGSLLLLP